MILCTEQECNSYDEAIVSRYLKSEYDSYRTKSLTFEEDDWGFSLAEVLQRWPDMAAGGISLRWLSLQG